MEVSSAHKSPISETRAFPGKYESLESIADFVREFAQNAGFESFAVYSIEMVVDEACSNIIEHAYGGEGKGTISCTCSIDEKSLAIVLQDQGKSFDPSMIPPPNLSQNLDDRKAHGLGMYFIHQWMDEVRFYSSGSGNILTMIKHK